MDVFVEKIVNSPISSNCFIIYKRNSSSCIIVDPGSKESFEVIAFITKNNLEPEFIILTHEHFDHVWGVNELKSIYDIKVISSQLCSDKIVDRKKNMSIFYDQIGFETNPCDITIESIENTLFWNDFKIDFIKTPGHTDCSISFLISDKIFVGDFIIPGFKTVTKLPSGNKKNLLDSLNFIENLSKGRNLKAYPGHGDMFWLDEINFENIS